MHSRLKSSLTVRELVVFAFLGALMFVSKYVTEVAPNVHLLGVFTVSFTVVYRKKALFPIYIFVLLMGMFNGFTNWWIPYLYLWFVLWAMVMLIPQKFPQKVKYILYIAVCGIHGFAYGILYAPAQAIMFGYTFKQTLTWISIGLPWDAVHGVSNILCGFLIAPIIKILKLADKTQRA